ncbi:MAG: hypothetical protein EHM50_07540 [Lysobacterales bacterium]|nr:MAG: hypothetical protein EHM50_07540 [Xanthomonadales bacterium]
MSLRGSPLGRFTSFATVGLVGFIVDAAREFVTIAPEIIHAPAEGITGRSGRYLRGVATVGDRMIMILDVAELLNNDEFATSGAPGAPQASQEK